MNDRKRTRETISADSTSTMIAVEVSPMRRKGPALWLTMTMNTSTLAAVGMVSPRMYLPGFFCPPASSRRESTLKRARRRAPAQTNRPAMNMPSRPKLVSPQR